MYVCTGQMTDTMATTSDPVCPELEVCLYLSLLCSARGWTSLPSVLREYTHWVSTKDGSQVHFLQDIKKTVSQDKMSVREKLHHKNGQNEDLK